VLTFGCFPGVWFILADVSENSICFIFKADDSYLKSVCIVGKMYRTIILPFVLYGCEAWSLILREKRRLRVFENRVLRRVFGPKRDEPTGEGRKLHNE
jgi:hypothetical protein